MTAGPTAFDGGPRCVLVVGSAYVVQGLVAAVGVLLAMQFAALGVALEDQGRLLASGAIPWVLKFGLALVFDLGPRWSLRVRGFALGLLQLGAAAGVWAIAQTFADGTPSSLLAVAVGWFVLNLCVATQDVIVDALALDSLATRRSAAATAMGVGVVLGFNVFGLWIGGGRLGTHGFASTLVWLASLIIGLALIPAATLAARTERPGRARTSDDPTPPTSARELAALLWIPPLFVALMFASSLVTAASPEFLFNHLRWDTDDVISILTPIALVAAVVGSLACGFVIAKFGPVAAGVSTSAALGLVWLGFAFAAPLWAEPRSVMIFALGEGAFQSAMLVALHGLALVAAARTPMPTTAFVLAMASLNLSRVLAPLLAESAIVLGWVGLFAACGVAQLVLAAGILPLRGAARVYSKTSF